MFLYVGNEQSVEETKKTIPFTLANQIIKYPGISLTNEGKNLYTENVKHADKN